MFLSAQRRVFAHSTWPRRNRCWMCAPAFPENVPVLWIQAESGFSHGSRETLPETHNPARLEAHLPQRLIPTETCVASGVLGGRGSVLHLVLQQSAVPALFSHVHQGAHGVRQATGIPRRHHLQPEPAAASTHEENRHIHLGEVAGAVGEGTWLTQLAGFPCCERGAPDSAEWRRRERRERAALAVTDFGLQKLPPPSFRVPAEHEGVVGPTGTSARGDAAVLSLSGRALRAA